MPVRLLSPISIAGVHQPVGTNLTLDPATEAELVNRGVATYTSRALVTGEGRVAANWQIDPSGNVTGLLGPDGGVRRISYSARQSAMGTRVVAAPIFNATTGAHPQFFDQTHQITARLAKRAYAVRLIFFGYNASETVGLSCAVAAADDVSGTSANASDKTWVPVTFGGSSTGTIPARQSATRPSIYLSDWVDVDVSTKIVVARALVPSSGNTELALCDMGQNSAPVKSALATVGGDEWVSRRQTGDHVSVPTGFNASSFQNYNLISGVQYLTTEGVITIAGVGDSITQGTYATVPNDAHWVRAARSLKLAGHGVETANFGWVGQNSGVYSLRVLDLLDAIKPQALVYGVWTPNDVGVSPTQAHIASMHSRWARVAYAGAASETVIIPLTGIPRSTGGHINSIWTAEQDDLRRGLNARIRETPIYLDPDIYLANRPNVGQIASGFALAEYVETTGYIHQTEAGNAVCAPAMETVLKSLL